MATGKGTVADYLAAKYQAKKYRFSEPINAILERLGLPNNRANQIKLGSGMRQIYGNDIWAQSLKKDILKDSPALAVIDGIRYPEDLAVSQTLPNFILISITTDDQMRYQRLKKRADRPGDNELSWKEFHTQHQSETEKNISQLLAKAQATINNNGDLNHTYQQIDALMQKYVSPK